MEREIRRYQNNLMTISTGVLILAAWTVLKSILYLTLAKDYILELIRLETPDLDIDFIFTAVIIVIIVVLVVDIAIRLFVAFSARAEGQGKKKGIVYLVLAGILIAFYAVMIYADISSLVGFKTGIMESVIAAIVDITACVTTIELIYSAVRLRKLQGEKHAA